MKRKSLLLIAMTVVLATVINLFAGIVAFADGADANDVIEIATAEDLKKIGTDANYPLSGNYKLTANIDLGGVEWTPIGTAQNDPTEGLFSGIFDGNGYTVSNFKMTTHDYAAAAGGWMARGGFFGAVSGTVKNLTISNATYTVNSGKMGGVGGIVGALYNGTISECKTTDTVTIEPISCSYWYQSGSSWLADQRLGFGGIVGRVKGGTVEYCENNATITVNLTGDNRTKTENGGIVGRLEGGTVTYCINNGNLTDLEGTNWGSVAGIVGRILKGDVSSVVTNCINNGNAKTEFKGEQDKSGGALYTIAGGIVGQTNDTNVTLSNNFNLGEVYSYHADDRNEIDQDVVLNDLAAQLIGWNNSDPATASDNYGLSGTGCLKFGQEKRTSQANSTLHNAVTLTTKDEIKANETYKAIVAEVAEHLTGISTDLYGYQTKAAEDGEFDMRLVATLSGDYTKLANVGFKVEATYTLEGEQQKSTVQTVTKLYNSITATNGEGVEAQTEHTAESLGGDYIYVLACKGLPANATDITFTVTTFYTATGAQAPVYSEVEVVEIEIPNDTLQNG